MEQHQEQLATLISLENGKPFAESRGEVTYSVGFFRWFANSVVRLEGSIPASTPTLKIEIHHRPVGLCSHYTMELPTGDAGKKCAAALAAGCGMLCKPAEETPFSAIALMRLIEDSGFPIGLVQMVLGDPQTIGEYFCTNPTIRKLSFTGSTEVGRLLMSQSAQNLQKLSMELGGNAPFVILESADLKLGLFRECYEVSLNSGQACISANRFIIVESRYDEVLNMLTKQTEQLIVGPAFENHTPTNVDIGPLISLKAVEKLHRLLHDALEKGAQLHSGTLPIPLRNLFNPSYSHTSLL